MDVCVCSSPTTAIRFDGELALVRCLGCDAQTWVLAGREIPVEVAFAALRTAFAQHRHDAPVRRPRAPRPVAVPAAAAARVVDLREAAEVEAPVPAVPQGADLQQALAAVLAEKGIAGSWRLSA